MACALHCGPVIFGVDRNRTPCAHSVYFLFGYFIYHILCIPFRCNQRFTMQIKVLISSFGVPAKQKNFAWNLMSFSLFFLFFLFAPYGWSTFLICFFFHVEFLSQLFWKTKSHIEKNIDGLNWNCWANNKYWCFDFHDEGSSNNKKRNNRFQCFN